MLEEFPVEASVAHVPKSPPAPLEGFVSEAELITPPLVLDGVANFSIADVEVRHSTVTPPPRLKTLNRRVVTGALVGALVATTAAWRIAGTPPSAPTQVEPKAERSVPLTLTQPTEVVESPPLAAPQKRPAQIAEVAAPIARMPVQSAPSPRVTAPHRTRVSPPLDSARPSVVMAAPLPVVIEPLLEASPPAQVPAAPEPALARVGRVENAPVASAATIDEREAIQNVLGEFRAAYADLDARAVKHVWPSASEAALAKAFANLESQAVAYYECDTTIAVETARAACEGQVSYVGRVGPRQPRTQNREWTFTLRKVEGDRWQIDRVQVR